MFKSSDVPPPVVTLRICRLVAFAGLLAAASGCGWLPKEAADAQTRAPRAERPAGATPVDVAIARTGTLSEPLESTGTTLPVREVSLRPQVEGKLLELNADVGDTVQKGQVLARLDDALQMSAVVGAEAELAARKSEVARAEAEVSNARTKVEEARLQLQQAQADANRLEQLYKEGAVSAQAAEQERTAARTAEQALRSAQMQVATQQQAVAAAQGRVVAGEAILAQVRERLSYAVLTSPIAGTVLQRVTEPGNLVQPGSEILKIGDFSQVKVAVDVSELELSNIRVGQRVRVKLDAYPQESFTGEVTRISPAADPQARRVPVEVTISNSSGKIGSGLLARVSFQSRQAERVLVPLKALEAGGTGRGGAGEQGSKGAGELKDRGALEQRSSEGVVFVVSGEGKEVKVSARSVQLGERANGQVEILSGLSAGERFVSRAGKPLKDGEAVKLSILSEK
ncbi:MAG: efflux RND transporter periplasmic adaptor subunit [Oscillatoria sp. Prado101]|nr:efflux RND transporter periplasmic adaptor subunit [Oscillatoria sp. Prado101]